MLVGIVPDFTLKNYIDLLSNPTTWSLYLSTLKFTLIVLIITFALGSGSPISLSFTSATW
jgi:putative spermidine/putrescine transport system permease protein